MTKATVTNLHPTEVNYRDHTIRLKLRPRLNDWSYEVVHVSTITLKNHAPRYDTALRLAKRDIDTLVDGRKAKT